MPHRLIRSLLVVIAALAALFGAAATAGAAGGSLDTAFGTKGVRVVSVGFDDNSALLVPDGDRLLVVGESTRSRTSESDIGMARLLSSGALDTTFSGDGKLLVSIEDGVDLPRDVVVQPDGKIVIVGTSGSTGKTLVVRRNADGSPDMSFGGGDGNVVADLVTPAYESIQAVALQVDGKIVVAGYVEDDSDTPRGSVLVVRLLANGTLDPTFGTGGVLRYNRTAKSVDLGFDVAVQPDGNLLVAGTSADRRFSGHTRHMALRLLPTGLIDPTFGIGTGVATPIAAEREGLVTPAIALNPLFATFVVAATVDVPGSSSFTTLRYNADGSLDSSYTRRSAGGFSGVPHSAHLFDDGSVVAATSGETTGEFDLAVQRVLSSGKADTCFDRGGIALVDGLPARGLDYDYGGAVHVAANGMIYVAGSTLTSSFSDFVVARLRGSTSMGCTAVSVAGRLRSHPDRTRLRQCGTSRRKACKVMRSRRTALQIDVKGAAALATSEPVTVHLLHRGNSAEAFGLVRTARVAIRKLTSTAGRGVLMFAPRRLKTGTWQLRIDRPATNDAQRGSGRTLWLQVS